jgi:hypothetical protein
MTMLAQLGFAAKLSLFVALVPAVWSAVYAIRPTEARLALMRPLSLAGLFAALNEFVLGLINMLRVSAESNVPLASSAQLMGLAEAFVPLFVAFGALTVGWLLVALGLRRQANG